MQSQVNCNAIVLVTQFVDAAATEPVKKDCSAGIYVRTACVACEWYVYLSNLTVHVITPMMTIVSW